MPVLATGSEDVHGERVRLGAGLLQSILGLAEGLAEVFEGVLKAICSHVFT